MHHFLPKKLNSVALGCFGGFGTSSFDKKWTASCSCFAFFGIELHFSCCCTVAFVLSGFISLSTMQNTSNPRDLQVEICFAASCIYSIEKSPRCSSFDPWRRTYTKPLFCSTGSVVLAISVSFSGTYDPSKSFPLPLTVVPTVALPIEFGCTTSVQLVFDKMKSRTLRSLYEISFRSSMAMRPLYQQQLSSCSCCLNCSS